MSDTSAATIGKPQKKVKNSGTSNAQSVVVRLGSLDSMLELAGQVIIVSSNLNVLSREIQEGSQVSAN